MLHCSRMFVEDAIEARVNGEGIGLINPVVRARLHASQQNVCRRRDRARVNNLTLGEFCFAMIGRADIEGSKSDVAMNAWPPQASYPCGNFSDTSCLKLLKAKRIDRPCFRSPMLTEHRDQASICPFALREVSVLAELALGHLRYSLTDVPPQSNSPPGGVLESDRDRA
ncbi:hypothetical protein RN001_013696 [Aquatica leii]|uniref:Uncharacterized protein n=1 Tax=Aquatica leii TaxID=1421715 RepID=A0AAN7S761_9COLE|nr:hypothetical protein RN001_013696 [Aquatica leii]